MRFLHKCDNFQTFYFLTQGKCNIIRKLDLREQLKWIKKRREEINKRRGRRKKHSDDVIDLLGVDGAVTEETDGKDEQVYKILVLTIG